MTKTNPEIRAAVSAALTDHGVPNGKGVRLDVKTWASLIGVALALIGAMAALMSALYMPRAEAQAAHYKHDQTVHGGAATKDQLHKLDKKIDAIGYKVGAQREIKRIEAAH